MFRKAIVAAMLLPLCLISCKNRTVQSGSYEPIPLFSPAYQALQKTGGQEKEYNLDATMRIIRAMEIARGQSKDFSSFMTLLAHQDYRYVAADVLQAQRDMFPILQKMYLLEQENEKFEGIWGLVTATEGALGNLVNTGLLSGDPVGVVSSLSLMGAVSDVFEQYGKGNRIKADNLEKLRALQGEYTQAIQDSWPVFLKYKEEWEKLCILKDQAYLDVYEGRNVNAYNLASRILESYPDDRDALLIKAISLAQRADFDTGHQIEAESLLDKYMDLYPERTAPAFMIKGIIAARTGDQETAFSHFNHASVEYPRQASALTDMLDAYMNRPYFSKTHEGLYFQQMYKATLEGYGAFSPNFQKAAMYEIAGNHEAAANEIYDHFFRRGNQAVHDYLLSDMEYCDNNMHGLFTSLFPASDLIELKVEGKKNILGKPRLDITLKNGSGNDLPNVRLFLCHHLVGMYPGDYVVEELEPVNIIANGNSHKWESHEYAQADIVYTRAVLLTDKRICWIDTPEYKAQQDLPRPEPQSDPPLILPVPGK